MITFTKISDVSGGQATKHVHLAVQQYDLVLAFYTAYSGGGAVLTTDTVSVNIMSYQHLVTSRGDEIGACYECLNAGTLGLTISAQGYENLDLYAVAIRPSSRCVDVQAVVAMRASDARVWSDDLVVGDGEFILCGQYASSASYHVRGTPQPEDKAGSAAVHVEDWALPEGATGRGNGFFELIHVDAAGTFRYYGPNPMTIRLTLQGQAILNMGCGSFVLV